MSKVRGGQVFVEIGADPRKLFKALGDLNKSIGKVGANVASAGAKLTALGAGIAAPIMASAHAFATVGSNLYDMSQRTGVAAESLSVLKFAAEQSGTDMASLETAIKKMQKAIFGASHGSKEASEALDLVGLSAKDLIGLPADKQMAKIADGLMAIEDPGARAAVAMKIFGKAGTAIIPMLEGGSAGMDDFARQAARLGLVMDSETAAKADSLGDAFDALSSAVRMAFVEIGSSVAPAMTQVATVLSEMTAGMSKFIRENQGLANAVIKGAVAVMAIGGALTALGLAISAGSAGFAGIASAIGGIAAVVGVVLSPIGLLVAGITAAVMLGPQLRGAFGGVLDGVADAAGGVGNAFRGMAADATVVFSDLASTASTTFNGIYAAIADGDLSGAMDVLWAGLVAGWLRGVEAIMGYVDPWISMFQNAFTILGAEIYKTWDWTWTSIAGAFNTVGAVIQGAMDNVINGVMAAWDRLEAGIRKSWNYIQSFFKKGMDLKEENNKVKSEMAARARKRKLERPGVEGRMDAAAKENKRKKDEMWARQDAVDANTQATIDGREAENRRRADQRRADTQAAEGNLAGKARGKRENRARNDQFTRLLKDIEGATTLDALRGMYEEFDALSSNGRLTSGQMATLETALEDAQERVSKATSSMGGTSPSDKIAAGAGAAGGEAAKSQSEVVGTFSANLSGMGFGSSLAQKQLDELRGIHNELKKDSEGLVAD
ncbi:MAG: phage tail tape measure protein [Planctomycetia bacterium]|jgi:hypothetical protein